MSTILVTGASGFIGRALAASLARHHDVICMSRRHPDAALREAVPCRWVRGDFGAYEDLARLDDVRIDAVAHLAAVTGGCLERDGILVNVEGTRCLMRYLMDHGCDKFVMASSIAAVGFQSERFRPLALPIPDEHPCLDRDGYGLSKHLMEEVTRYYQRQNEGIDVTNLRLATIADDANLPPPRRAGPQGQWCLGRITVMARSDAVRAFTLALEAPHRQGVRTLNAAPPRAWVAEPVAEILHAWWGDDVDLGYYRDPAHAFDAVYDVTRIREELGFVAECLPT